MYLLGLLVKMLKEYYCNGMHFEQRKDERYEDIGRVEAPELCVFPGKLEDISMFGCKIRFPAIIELEADLEVDLKLTPTRKDTFQNITLIGHQMWCHRDNDSTVIGFRFLRSPGSRSLVKYIEKLALAAAEYEEEEEMLSLCM